MINKIIRLKSVGLFADAIPSSPLDLTSATIIYGENGRGKSTLASIFSACSEGDEKRINAKKTIDSDLNPEIQILVHDGTSHSSILFSNQTWNTHLPSIMVFDSEFVDRNVYSGFEVNNEQKKGLLEFALGDEAVRLKNRLNEINDLMQQASNKRREAESKLERYCSPLPVTDFVELAPNEQIDNMIERHQSRVDATKRVNQILNLKNPNRLVQMEFNLESAIHLLQLQIDDLQDDAEDLVIQHIDNHNSAHIEHWLSQGQGFSQDICPFCGQNLEGIALVSAYRSYFSQEYKNLKEKIDHLLRDIDKKLGDAFLSKIENQISLNNSHLDAWMEHISFANPQANILSIKDALVEVKTAITNLAYQKQQRPLDRIGSREQFDLLEKSLSKIAGSIQEYNTTIDEISSKVINFKETLGAENLQNLEKELSRLISERNRKLPDVNQPIEDFKSANEEYENLQREKTNVRNNLDQHMNSTLERYQERVNHLVASFHAEFVIEKMKADYRSRGNPRSNFGLRIRNQSIGLGSRDDMYSMHSFGNALSEADKRTLAFAFFIAKLENDPDLSKRIVVLDDPVSSLDMNRRRETIRLITELATKCRQLIVLSHDAYFVRDLRDKLQDPYPQSINPVIHEIRRSGNGYSTFVSCDIDSKCASPYYHHYKIVSDYVNGVHSSNSRDVAKAIRPLLEGYLHRRFPNRISRGQMFGKVIEDAEQATSPDILANIYPILGKLRAINNYAKNFHHDTNPDADNFILSETELHDFARQSLEIIHEHG